MKRYRFGLFVFLGILMFSIGSMSPAFAAETYVAKVAGNVSVDGDVLDWLGVDGVVAEDPTGAVGPVELYAQYDSEYLYFLVVAEDEVQHNKASGVNIWQGDSLQISIDADNTKTSAYDAGDYEFGWALTDSGLQQYQWKTAQGVTYDPASILFAVKRVEANRNGKAATIYEIAIPKGQLAPMKLESGTVVGFNFLINDDDGKGRNWLEWTEGTGSKKSPSYYNNMLLE